MVGMNQPLDGAAPAGGLPRPLVVAIGASNLSRGLSRLVAVSQAWAGGPIDLVVAAGHGRSFGANSRVWNRRLPSILGCGLWRSLDRLLADQAAADRPKVAIMTDIGNDLLYGFTVEQLASWVEETLVRLRQRGFQVVITRLPLASIAGVGPFQYRLLKTVFVPGCPLSLEQVRDRSAEIDAAIVDRAGTFAATVIDQPADWYGCDAIHLRRSSLAQLWAAAAACWDYPGLPRRDARAPRWFAWTAWVQLGMAAAEVRSLNRVMLFTRQPAVQLADTTRVFLY